MKFTFGIITSASTNNYLKSCVDSIKSQKIDKDSFEIIIVGDSNIGDEENIKKIGFEESIKPLWITRKKNLITENSSFDNICYLHDYVSLEEGWYEGFLKFGESWDICMNPIVNLDGTRCLDWMGLPDDPIYGNVVLPYNYEGSKGMYVPGYYWVAKKKVMEDFPLNENFVWNEGEDIEWSKRVLGGYPQRWLKNLNDFETGKIKTMEGKYLLNPFSRVKFLKQKNFHSGFFSEYDLHSGRESRPLESIEKNYYYLKFNKTPSRIE